MRLLLIVCFLLCSYVGTSQIILKKKPDVSKIPGIESLYKNLTMPKATFLVNTDKGKVYALPLDNMPCLVPNGYRSNMPVAGLFPNASPIPNASNRYELIPKSDDPASLNSLIEKFPSRK